MALGPEISRLSDIKTCGVTLLLDGFVWLWPQVPGFIKHNGPERSSLHWRKRTFPAMQ